jgi:hypothetical protein
LVPYWDGRGSDSEWGGVYHCGFRRVIVWVGGGCGVDGYGCGVHVAAQGGFLFWDGWHGATVDEGRSGEWGSFEFGGFGLFPEYGSGGDLDGRESGEWGGGGGFDDAGWCAIGFFFGVARDGVSECADGECDWWWWWGCGDGDGGIVEVGVDV